MNLIKKIKNILIFIRLDELVLAGICVLVGEILALGKLPTITQALLGFFTAFFISGSAMILNGYFDLEVDKINAPHRPLPMGLLSKNEVFFLAIMFTILGFITAALLGLIPLVIAIIIWFIGFLYSWRIKETGLPGNMMVSTAAAGTFIFGGSAVGEPFKLVLLTFSIMAFLFTLGGEIAGDAMDIEGDIKRNAKTLAITLGKKIALIFSSVLIIGFILMSLIPYIMGWLGHIFLILIILADASLLYFIICILKSKTSEEGRKIIRQYYYVIAIVLIAFVLGIIQI